MELLGKSQWVRLLDVFILGPFMIWYAIATYADTTLSKEAPIALFISGVLTILYNGLNWLRIAGLLGLKN
jgi:hypothetical protein